MKLRIAPGDNKQRVFAWISERNTLIREVARKWNVPEVDIPEFVQSLWQYLTSEDVGILVPVTLRSNKNRPLPGYSDVFQINATKLLLSENHGYYRCVRCRRKSMRRTPGSKCMAWQCDGKLEFVREVEDNYNLQLLDERYEMLRPEVNFPKFGRQRNA